jgi:parallel beta-helix repeat protein
VLLNSTNNNFTGNTLNSNGGHGVYLTNSSTNTLDSNTASDNSRGIYLISSSGNNIINNAVLGNREFGILLSYSIDNNISGNEVSNGGRGIHLSTSQSNTISRNIIARNSISGIFMSSTSNDNIFFDNYLNNVFNSDVKDGSAGNVWNVTKTAGTNIVGGPFIAGNFWAKPDGTGFSQTATDGDGDGIADTAYKLPGNNYSDFLPLVGGSEPELSVSPPVDVTIPASGAGIDETEITTNETAVNRTETNKMESENELNNTGNKTIANTTDTNKTKVPVNGNETQTNKTKTDDDSKVEMDIDEMEDDMKLD